MRVLLDRLTSHRYVIRQEIRSLLRAPDAPDGSGPIPGSRKTGEVDPKVITRMINKLERAGKLKRLWVAVPVASRAFGTTRQVGGPGAYWEERGRGVFVGLGNRLWLAGG